MLIDTHAHLNFKAFRDTYKEIIQRTLKNDCWIINVGSQYETSKRAVEIANEFPQGVFAAVGFHPVHVEADGVGDNGHYRLPESRFQYDQFKALAQNPKVIAIGETGLDFFHTVDNLSQQEDLLKQHIKLAKELKKPLIVHCRNSSKKPGEAYQRLYEVLSVTVGDNGHYRLPNGPGVIHCYLGTLEMAQKFLNLGFYISFTGIITFKNAKAIQEVAKEIPLDRLLLETDCPYLAPEPHRGKQNEPLYTQYIAQKHAELRGIPVEQVIDQTTENAKGLFDLNQ